MPVIRLEYDDAIISDPDATSLSKAIRDIVAKETGIDDVFVYANSARIKVQISPVEVFIEISAHLIKDMEELLGRFRAGLVEWKGLSHFPHPVNLTLIPMTWKFETGI